MSDEGIRPDAGVPLVIGVTGHRDLLPGEEPLLERLVEQFFRDLQVRYPALPLRVITPLAEGADRLVATVARRMGIAITVLLPMPAALYRADFSGASDAVFTEMLGYGEIVELPMLGESDLSAIGQVGSLREAQYAYLAVYLAAHSHILLALWDGRDSGAPGGTSSVVRFHQEAVIELLAGAQHRSPIDFSEDESDLVHHIVCSRRESGAPLEGLRPGECYWLSRDDLEPRTRELPVRYHRIFQRHAMFNEDLAGLGASIGRERLADYSRAPNRAVIADVHELYQRVDELALRYQKRAYRSLRAMFTFAGLTGISFILYADFSGLDQAIYLYLGFLVLSLGLYLLERRRDWYRKYLDYRGLAEGLRVQFFWSLAGVPANSPTRFSHDSFMRHQDLEIGWIRNIMRYAGRRLNATLAHADEDSLELAIEVWIGDEQSGEIGYYRRRVADRLRRSRITFVLNSGSFVVGVLLAFVLAIAQELVGGGVRNLFIGLMGALPFIAAVRQSYAHRISERELIVQYSYMARIFGNSYRMLSRTNDPVEKRDVLRALGEAELDELGAWIMRHRERPMGGSQMFQVG